jgi:hypothetical protein
VQLTVELQSQLAIAIFLRLLPSSSFFFPSLLADDLTMNVLVVVPGKVYDRPLIIIIIIIIIVTIIIAVIVVVVVVLAVLSKHDWR